MSEPRTAPEPVAIIGLGCLFPQAEDLRSYWRNILEGRDAITEVPPSHWDPADYLDADPRAPDRTYAARGGFLSPVAFPPLEFGITPNSLPATDTTQLLGLLAARRALDDAGYTAARDFDRSRTSVILGVTGTLPLVIPLGARLGHPVWRRALEAAGVPADVAADVMDRIAASYVGWQEESFPGLLGNVVAGRIANRLNLGGTNCVVDAACASSLSALHLALLELQAGRCDMALTGGMDTFNDIFMYMCFSKTPALSPGGDARPFDSGADGTTLGEGIGAVLLKRLADAERDGDPIHAVIRGVGTSSDGKGQAIYAPSPAGQVQALRDAYAAAGVSPADVELVEAHGTGTRAGDAAEVAALLEVYRSAGRPGTWCALGSVKSQIGHTKAAAGAAGLIKAALALRHRVLPPTIKVEQPIDPLRPGRSPFYVNTQARPWPAPPRHPRRAAVSSFGFGGSNFHCVLEEYPQGDARPFWDGDVQLLALSAGSRPELQALADAALSVGDWHQVWVRAARSRQEFRPDHPHRLAVVLQRGQDLTAVRQRIGESLTRPTGDRPPQPAGARHGEGPPPGKLAVLFPGQGSQYVGMLRDLACRFPALLQALEEANGAFASVHGGATRLSDLIHPQPAFAPEDRDGLEQRLRSTDAAQPAIGAAALGAWRVLQSFAVRPDAFAGHSFGELTALCAAGRLTAARHHELACHRGRLMAAAAGSGGGMLAAHAPAHAAEALLRDNGLSLTVANLNGPAQTVLSGPLAEIDRAATVFAACNIPAQRLPVAAAFHSPHVAGVAPEFLSLLGPAELQAGGAPVYANSTAAAYPVEPAAARELLAQQLARPVLFAAMVEAMYAAGVRTFVEVGPGSVLTGLVGKILAGRPHHALALDAARGKASDVHGLAGLLGALAALGYPVDLTPWAPVPPDVAAAAGRKPTLTVPICGANCAAPLSPGKPGGPGPERPAQAPPANGRRFPVPAVTPAAPDTEPVQEQRMNAQHHPERRDAGLPYHADPGANGRHAGTTPDAALAALQRLSEQTAELHRRFLETQTRALEVLESLLGQRQPAPAAAPPRPHPAPPDHQHTPRRDHPNGVANHAVPPEPQRPAATRPEPAPEPAPRVSPPPSPEPAGAPPGGEATAVVLAVVAEKTGYPAEVLSPEMDLDADLGIDSIKRVEIFSALQERLPAAPQVAAEQIARFATLADVIGFLGAASVAQTPPREPAPPAPAAPTHEDGARDGALLRDIIAEKTGYPPEVLQLDMELDADLGIDSIKRVEIFSAVQERLPDAPAIEADRIGSFRTLRDVLDFLSGDRQPPAPMEGPATQPTPPVSHPTANAPSPLLPVLLAVVAEKTGYPPEMLELHQELDGDLGIDSIKRVEIFSALQERVPSLPAVGADAMARLRTLQDVLDHLCAGADPAPHAEPAPPSAAGPPPRLTLPDLQRLVPRPSPLADAGRPRITLPTGATVWLVGPADPLTAALRSRLDALGFRVRHTTPAQAVATPAAGPVNALILVAPAGPTAEDDVLTHLQALQAAGPLLPEAARDGRACLLTVSRVGGLFGLREQGPVADPESAGLGGLLKTAACEWPAVRCKSLDVDPSLDAGEAARRVAAELTLDGPLEVAIDATGAHAVELQAAPQSADGRLPLTPGDVVLVTGGARGVTAEVAVRLAELTAPTLVLLGRSPLPQPEPDWLSALHDERDLKQALARRANGHATPRRIAEEYRGVVAGREVEATLARLRQAGARAAYLQADVCDPTAVAAAVAEIQRQFGPVKGLIHGAGVLADRRIEDKTPDQFRHVYRTKVGGLRNLLGALAGQPLSLLALFSSSTARFGRAGQADYAAANEALNKIAQAEARRRPGCRVVSFNWGPWAGGMVTPALRQLFAQEGIAAIPLRDGADFFAAEIARPDNRDVEVVVLGRPPEPAAPAAASAPVSAPAPAGLEPVLQRDVSVATHPVLRSHVIQGRAVLPVVLTLEWFAHAALHRHPGLVFHGCDDFRVLKGVRLEPGQTVPLQVLAGQATKAGPHFAVPVELRETTAAGQHVAHARAVVLLGQSPPAAPAPREADGGPGDAFPVAEAYRDALFHGPDLHGLQHVHALTDRGAAAEVATAPRPDAWLRQPPRGHWLADPLALDSAFQLMVLWCRRVHGLPSLPTCLRRYRQFARFPRQPVRVVATVGRHSRHAVTADIDWVGPGGALIARLEGYECAMNEGLADSFRNRELAPAATPY